MFSFTDQFFGQKLLDRGLCELEDCHDEESNCWAKVQAFISAQLHITTSLFPHKLG
jgi:hypothetical protein